MNPTITRQKAQELFQVGQFKKARKLYEKLVASNTRDPELLYMTGCTYKETGDLFKASNFFKKALTLAPNAFIVHCALGLTHKEMRHLEEAEQSFRQAVKLQPDSVDAKLELSGILLAQDNTTEAEALLQEITQKQPDCADAILGLGEIYHARRQLDKAIMHYEQALKLRPNHAETLNRLGFVYQQKGHPKQAIDLHNRAIASKPDFADAYVNLGTAQLYEGLLDLAIISFDKAIKLAPNLSAAYINKANAHEKMGEHQKAYDIVKPLLKKNEQLPSLATLYTKICRKIDHCYDAISYATQLLSQPDIFDSAKEQIHYSLGELQDKLKNYDEAFLHFKAANDLRPVTFRTAEHSAHTHAIMQVFDFSHMKSAPHATIETDTPIFIVGMPRSGTSLTEQILASHDEIFGAGELSDISEIAINISAISTTHNEYPFSFKGLSQQTIDAASQKYLENIRALSPKSKFITDKMPQNFIYLGLIEQLFPATRVIHCMRDPIDTCLSIYFQHFSESHDYATRLEHIGQYYLDYRRLMSHWKSVLQIPILDLEYSQLVTEPEPTIRKLLDFVGVEWDPKCLEFHKSDRYTSTASYDQVRQQLYTRSLDRWKNYEQHIGPLKEILAPLYN